MKKRLLVVAVLVMAVLFSFGSMRANAVEPAESFNHWLYLNLNLIFSPQWSLHIMPGHSYEYTLDDPAKTGEEPKGTFLTEFFIGPWYSTKLTDNLGLKMGVEYYFMGFRKSKDDDKFAEWYNHCVEVIPVFSYKVSDKINLASRTIFHNVLYTSDDISTKTVKNDSKNGWGMLIREMITVTYHVNSLIALSLGNEFFIGVVEEDGLATTQKYTKGYNENRIIPGITFKNLAKGLSLTTNYIYRTSFNTGDNEPKPGFDKWDTYDKKHYIQFILTYNYDL